MRSFTATLAASAACIALISPAMAEEIPHRDDWVMNSIVGGDFRQYIFSITWRVITWRSEPGLTTKPLLAYSTAVRWSQGSRPPVPTAR